SVRDLLKTTDSSIATLRRDINFLSKNGKLKKIRGGIIGVETNDSENISYLYKNRERFFYNEKEAIGIAAQEFIKENDIILLTYGTTTAQVAKYIDTDKHVTVITNGIDIISILQNKPNVDVILLGGKVDYSYKVIKGPSVFKMLEDLHPSKVIMGAGGITEEKGITGYDFLNSTFLTRVIESIEKCIIVADHSKFDSNVLVHIAPINKIDVIITDSKVPSKYLEIFKKYEIDYLIA
ncbi:MAG: DeoR/GlpR transcriptional regulator, partial [Spirochaetes bacterium]|nr:DeoR/GlpR transcriptional regulator [Spirochaetota bacterium]